MMAGETLPVNVGSFTNDMTTFHSEDDVFTLLVHLGYLGYDFHNKCVFIPNNEVRMEYANAVSVSEWGEVSKALSYTISLALYAARNFYTIYRELPTGKGFADIVYVPRRQFADKPAIVVEIKWDKSAQGAIEQIKNKQYVKSLEEYSGDLYLVGVNYDKKNKVHQCKIEKWKKL